MRKSRTVEAAPQGQHTGQLFVGDGPSKVGTPPSSDSSMTTWVVNFDSSGVFWECFWSCAIRVEQHVLSSNESCLSAEESQQCSVPSRWWTCWYFQHSRRSYVRDFRFWQSSSLHASACGRHVPALRLPSDDERLPKRRSVRLLPF